MIRSPEPPPVTPERVAHPRLAERVRAIPPSGIRRFFDVIATMKDVISLSIGEPDFATPEQVRRAAADAVDRIGTKYTSNAGMIELRRGIARHLNDLYGATYDPETEIVVTTGVSEALDLAARALLDPGDGCLVPDPGYVAYSACVSLAGGVVQTVPCDPADGFRLDPARVAGVADERSRVLLVASPCNPTGAVTDRPALERLAELAFERDLTVISDEIYDRLVYDGKHVCFPTLPGARERTVLLGGFSKAYAMTGWRVGYAAGPAEIVAGMLKIHQYTALSSPTVGQYAALEALASGEPNVRRMVAEYDRRRRFLVDGLNAAGLPCPLPGGAFYAFPSVAGVHGDDVLFAETLLEEEHVAVVPGTAFGAHGRDHVRCCYATSLEQLDEAVRRIARFVKRHRGAGAP